jgi:hypothetical protein
MPTEQATPDVSDLLSLLNLKESKSTRVNAALSLAKNANGNGIAFFFFLSIIFQNKKTKKKKKFMFKMQLEMRTDCQKLLHILKIVLQMINLN